jgi:serine/threonine-protein kinase
MDPYELIAEIASGGMATVFLARRMESTAEDPLYAIKRLHPHLHDQHDFLDMFLDEGRLAGMIHDAHVVRVLDVGEGAAGHYLVMEYIEGDTLNGLLSRALSTGAARLPPEVAIRVVYDVLMGLHAAHELRDEEGRLMGLVHRDATPHNILVGIDGLARLTDFGVARAASRRTLSRPMQIKGKVGFLSPEQARAEDVDRRSDIFTVGIVLWEMLTGQALFQASTEEASLARLSSTNPPPIETFVPELVPALDEVCQGALQPDRLRRYRTAAEMAEALERAASSPRGPGMASALQLGRYVRKLMGAEILAQREAVLTWAASQKSVRTPVSAPPRSSVGPSETTATISSRPPTTLPSIHAPATAVPAGEDPPRRPPGLPVAHVPPPPVSLVTRLWRARVRTWTGLSVMTAFTALATAPLWMRSLRDVPGTEKRSQRMVDSNRRATARDGGASELADR